MRTHGLFLSAYDLCAYSEKTVYSSLSIISIVYVFSLYTMNTQKVNTFYIMIFLIQFFISIVFNILNKKIVI